MRRIEAYRSNNHRKLVAAAALVFLAACFVGPDYEAQQRVELPKDLAQLPFLQDDWKDKRRGAKPGRIVEVERPKLTGVDTEGMEERLKRRIRKGDVDNENDGRRPSAKDMLEFEFFHLESGRSFRYEVRRGDLSAASRAVSPEKTQRRVGRKVAKEDIEREDEQRKSWSNATDNRTRRAIADGFSDTHSIYQSFADYGGCTATVLYASNSMMVAITAAHCIYVSGGSYSSSALRPRRDGGTSPTWGTWNVYAFGFYPQFLDNDCEDNFRTKCIKHDIALVLASPAAGASPPNSFGWGYRPKSFLDDHTKYRRGYPSCSSSESPSPCSSNNLYGDGSLSVGSFKNKSGGWHRRCRHSSDTTGGDSGSSLYYYRDGNPYVFGVHSASDDCDENCTGNRPCHARLNTEEWFDFINSVVP